MKLSTYILYLSLFFTFLLGKTASAQTLIDSVYQELNSNQPTQKKIDYLKDANSRLLLTHPDTVIYYAKYALRLIKKTNNLNDKVAFLGLLGEAHLRVSNYSLALKNMLEATKVSLQLKDSSTLAYNYNNIGNVYRVSGKLDEANDYYNKALLIRAALKDSSGIAFAYNNIGIIYMIKAEYDTGMTYWGNSLKIKLAIGDSLGASTTMNNMAMYYRDIGKTDKALELLTHVLEIKKRINDYIGVSLTYDNLAGLYLKQGEMSKAISYYQLALDEAEKANAKQLIGSQYFNLAKTHYQDKKFQEAYDYLNSYYSIKDSIFSEKTIKTLADISTKYESEKKALLIKNLEIDKIAQTEKQTLTIIASGVGFLAMLIIILIVFKNYRQKKKDHRIISDQKNILQEKNKEITDSITYAKRLQEAILPPSNFIQEKLPNSFILFMPKDVVSGDFYWVEQIKENTLFAVADCTGHGVPGAMVSVVCSNALHRAVKEFNLSEPAKILNKVRTLVIETFEKSSEEVKDGMDISLCLFNSTTNELEYAGANNPLWILRKDQTEIEEIKADKQPIGIYMDNEKAFTNHKIQLNKGDNIYLFSDGFADQFGGEKGKKLKYKPFRKMLISIRNKSMSDQKAELSSEFKKWKGEIEQIDDVCILGVSV